MDDVCGAMVQMSMDGTINFWNSSAESMLGYAESDVIGKNGFQLIFTNMEEAEDMLSIVTIGEVYYSFESYAINSEGEKQPVALVTSPINDEDGSVTGLTILISNILLI